MEQSGSPPPLLELLLVTPLLEPPEELPDDPPLLDPEEPPLLEPTPPLLEPDEDEPWPGPSTPGSTRPIQPEDRPAKTTGTSQRDARARDARARRGKAMPLTSAACVPARQRNDRA